MYNQDIKSRFIWENEDAIERSSAVYNAYARLFALSSELESHAGKDLAAFDPVELRFLDLMVKEKGRMLPMRYKACLLRYLDWCHGHVDINAAEGINYILSSLQEYKDTVVSGPIHMQIALDGIFHPEERENIDVMYRCFLWIAFAGVRSKEDADTILVSDIDLSNRFFVFDGDKYPIYPQALKAFDITLKNTDFVYEHPNYTRLRPRIDNNKFLRGFKGDADDKWIMVDIRKKTAAAHKRNQDAKRLSYRSALHSGIFYRQYEQEAAGMDVDFSHLIKDKESDQNAKRKNLTMRRANINACLKDEYYIWKYLMYKDKV